MNKKEIGHPCLVCTCTVGLWLVCTVICIVVYHPNCLQCFDAVGWQQWHTRVCVYHPTVLLLVPNYFLHIHSVIYLNWRTWGHVCSSSVRSSVGVVMVTAWLCVCLSGFVAILWQHLWMWPCCDSVFVCLSVWHHSNSVSWWILRLWVWSCCDRVSVCLCVCLSVCLWACLCVCIQQFSDVGRDEYRVCERLVHDQHLQHQGWAAVVANLDDITRSLFSVQYHD